MRPPNAVMAETYWCNANKKCEGTKTEVLSPSKLDVLTKGSQGVR
jgi:hypothetical protein